MMKTYAWKRFGARLVDGALLCFPFLFGLVQIAEKIQLGLADTLAGSLVLSALASAAFLFSEPFLIARYGHTPGKWLFGLKVLKKSGRHLSSREAFTRTAQVITMGLGLSLRGLVFATLAYQAFRLIKDKQSPWDAQLGSACLPLADFSLVVEEAAEEDYITETLALEKDEVEHTEELLEEAQADELVAEAPVAAPVQEEVVAAAEEIPELEDPTLEDPTLKDPTLDKTGGAEVLTLDDAAAAEAGSLELDLDVDKAA